MRVERVHYPLVAAWQHEDPVSRFYQSSLLPLLGIPQGTENPRQDDSISAGMSGIHFPHEKSAFRLAFEKSYKLKPTNHTLWKPHDLEVLQAKRIRQFHKTYCAYVLPSHPANKSVSIAIQLSYDLEVLQAKRIRQFHKTYCACVLPSHPANKSVSIAIQLSKCECTFAVPKSVILICPFSLQILHKDLCDGDKRTYVRMQVLQRDHNFSDKEPDDIQRTRSIFQAESFLFLMLLPNHLRGLTFECKYCNATTISAIKNRTISKEHARSFKPRASCS
ncbi:unnamed protein product [Albugo candida]|uniref:Uncharacterized protein n=1 Tax=Albugo candida TaxID=65357 RepID=A0A024GC11_9STRA|nr:unnamed protein product [Albugo candida]|eukprot:CCI44219.1 unnamed protein product [Albugo candida]